MKFEDIGIGNYEITFFGANKTEGDKEVGETYMIRGKTLGYIDKKVKLGRIRFDDYCVCGRAYSRMPRIMIEELDSLYTYAEYMGGESGISVGNYTIRQLSVMEEDNRYKAYFGAKALDIFPNFDFRLSHNIGKEGIEYDIHSHYYGGEFNNLGEFEIITRYGINKGRVKEISYKEFIELFIDKYNKWVEEG